MARNWYQRLIDTVGLDEARRIARERANARNAVNRQQVRERQRAYYARDPEKWRAYERKKYRTNRKKEKERSKRNRLENRLKAFARDAVAVALRSGLLVRPKKCGKCGKAGRITAHHSDYTRPLKVDWLCSLCHAARHRKEEGRDADGG
jgi:hypothetical protein